MFEPHPDRPVGGMRRLSGGQDCRLAQHNNAVDRNTRGSGSNPHCIFGLPCTWPELCWTHEPRMG